MPSPALIVGGVIIAVGAGFAFKQFVYDPYLADRVHELLDEFAERRANRHRRLVEPHPAAPSPRAQRSPTDFMNEKHAPIGDAIIDAGASTGTEMREVSSVSGALRRRGPASQRNSAELEMGVIGHPFPLVGLDSTAPARPSALSSTTRQNALPADVRSPPPVQAMPTPPVTTSPRSPFSEIRTLSEISFDAPSSSDPLEYQFSPPVEVHATFSPTAPPRTLSPPALFSPPSSTFSSFALQHSPPSDPFVDLPAPSQRPTSPWSELSAHSAATAGQLHLRLSRTDSDSEQEHRSDSGSDGSWEHT